MVHYWQQKVLKVLLFGASDPVPISEPLHSCFWSAKKTSCTNGRLKSCLALRRPNCVSIPPAQFRAETKAPRTIRMLFVLGWSKWSRLFSSKTRRHLFFATHPTKRGYNLDIFFEPPKIYVLKKRQNHSDLFIQTDCGFWKVWKFLPSDCKIEAKGVTPIPVATKTAWSMSLKMQLLGAP